MLKGGDGAFLVGCGETLRPEEGRVWGSQARRCMCERVL
jgi:hypothetical protein